MIPITRLSTLMSFSMWNRGSSRSPSCSSPSKQAPFFASAWKGLPFLARQIGGGLFWFSRRWATSQSRSRMIRCRSLDAMRAAPEPACPSNTPQKCMGMPVVSWRDEKEDKVCHFCTISGMKQNCKKQELFSPSCTLCHCLNKQVLCNWVYYIKHLIII